MSHRILASLRGLAVVLVVAWLAPSVAGQGQTSRAKPTDTKTWTPPRTPWGDPDLQGMWANRAHVPFERPKEFGTREFLTEQELKEAERELKRSNPEITADAVTQIEEKEQRRAAEADKADDGRPGYRISGAEHANEFWNGPANHLQSRRTSAIVDPKDGQMPAYRPEALKRFEAREAARSGRSQGDSWEDRNLNERCEHTLTNAGGADGTPLGLTAPSEIFQSPGYVAIQERNRVRIIPLAGQPHDGATLRQWNGDSRGHWEGNTLVIETTNFNDKQDGGPIMPSHTGVYGYGHSHNYPGTGTTLRIIERLTRVGPDTMEHTYTIDDPKVWVRPWTVVYLWGADDDQPQMFEYACHEHNYGMANMLRGNANEKGYVDNLDEASREVRTRKKQLAEQWEKTKKWEESNKGSNR